MPTPMMREPPPRPAVPRPLVPLATAFAAGIAVQGGLPLPPAAWLGGVALSAAGAALAWRARARGPFRLAAALLFACLGGQAMAATLVGHPSHHLSRLADEWLRAPVAIEAWVAEPPDPAPPETRDPPERSRTRFVVEVDRVRLGDRWLGAAGRARLTLYDQPAVRLAYGDEIRALVRLRHLR